MHTCCWPLLLLLLSTFIYFGLFCCSATVLLHCSLYDLNFETVQTMCVHSYITWGRLSRFKSMDRMIDALDLFIVQIALIFRFRSIKENTYNHLIISISLSYKLSNQLFIWLHFTALFVASVPSTYTDRILITVIKQASSYPEPICSKNVHISF